MNKKYFDKITNEYTFLREEERKAIIDCLANKKDKNNKPLFFKKNGKKYDGYKYFGGTGESDYSSGDTLEVDYDLSNHKWIDTIYKGCHILISLQSFDIDKNSGNIHLLYNRIGVIYNSDKIKIIDIDGKKNIRRFS